VRLIGRAGGPTEDKDGGFARECRHFTVLGGRRKFLSVLRAADRKGKCAVGASFFLRVKQPGQPDRQPSALVLKHATLA
jgi:hypothetical protein